MKKEIDGYPVVRTISAPAAKVVSCSGSTLTIAGKPLKVQADEESIYIPQVIRAKDETECFLYYLEIPKKLFQIES